MQASLKIASEIDIYTNDQINVEELTVSKVKQKKNTDLQELTPKEIVAKLDEHIIGQADAKRAVCHCATQPLALEPTTRRNS